MKRAPLQFNEGAATQYQRRANETLKKGHVWDIAACEPRITAFIQNMQREDQYKTAAAVVAALGRRFGAAAETHSGVHPYFHGTRLYGKQADGTKTLFPMTKPVKGSPTLMEGYLLPKLIKVSGTNSCEEFLTMLGNSSLDDVPIHNTRNAHRADMELIMAAEAKRKSMGANASLTVSVDEMGQAFFNQLPSSNNPVTIAAWETTMAQFISEAFLENIFNILHDGRLAPDGKLDAIDRELTNAARDLAFHYGASHVENDDATAHRERGIRLKKDLAKAKGQQQRIAKRAVAAAAGVGAVPARAPLVGGFEGANPMGDGAGAGDGSGVGAPFGARVAPGGRARSAYSRYADYPY